MRMRRLGRGQTGMFSALGEVNRRSRALILESANGVRVIDILRWAMHETGWGIFCIRRKKHLRFKSSGEQHNQKRTYFDERLATARIKNPRRNVRTRFRG